jgi:putative transposase
MTKCRHFQELRTYHVTHRCHNKGFLLKAGIDRDEYVRLMWEAYRQWDLSILSYVVTSNHVHLLLSSRRHEDMSGFMAHVSGGMGNFHNRRKARFGSFWEGRYRSTLVQDGTHLMRCLVYIALNMVRAGVARHPDEWDWSSHLELAGKKQRYRLIDMDRLLEKTGASSFKSFSSWYEKTIEEKCLQPDILKREPWWSQASFVGTSGFVSSLVEKRKEADIVHMDDGTSYF